ncbi:MAG: DUF2855 family protein [Ilumatobacteraceae bacterium]|nr:DUF2855 family protein [Ilumatobacteraceae bacterium]
MTTTVRSLEVSRADLRRTQLVEAPVPTLGAGQALLRVDTFALTANNITYGVAGDMIGYWDFFPATEGWGRIPVWGFADVVQGTDDLPEGTRVFGYLPMSTHLVVEPQRRGDPATFRDASAHRAHLPPTYNQYRLTSHDPLHSADTEGVQAVFFPLFMTSFVLDDWLADNADFGAARVVLSSASSKTAAGTALCISRRTGDRPTVVGLTSAGHRDFVDGLGFYDEVVTYDDVASLDASVPTVFVDIAGNASVRHAVHSHLGDSLRASSVVGITHWEEQAGPTELPGPAPQMFFAPSQIEKRSTDWGPGGLQERFAVAWSGLLDVVGDWVRLVRVDGFDALATTYDSLVDGSAPPDEAYVVTLG